MPIPVHISGDQYCVVTSALPTLIRYSCTALYIRSGSCDNVFPLTLGYFTICTRLEISKQISSISGVEGTPVADAHLLSGNNCFARANRQFRVTMYSENISDITITRYSSVCLLVQMPARRCNRQYCVMSSSLMSLDFSLTMMAISHVVAQQAISNPAITY
jgi:hypothetical protein